MGMRQDEPLTRSLFSINRTMEFFSERELATQIGADRDRWFLAIMKELIDNSLDACESKRILPEIEIEVAEDFLKIRDNGPGLPDPVIKDSLDYMVRVSDKILYVSPSRGQLGNALMCLYAIPFVLHGQYGKVEIETGGELHTIEIMLERIFGSPRITRTVTNGDFVKTGTSITIYEQAHKYLSAPPVGQSYICNAMSLITAYVVMNPHASFTLHGTMESKNARTSDSMNKWIPSDPMSSYWYGLDSLRGLIAGHVSSEREGGQAKTVGDFISQFRGLTGSRKRKEVTDLLGMQRTYLHDLVDGDDISDVAVDSILSAMNECSKPLKPKLLGVIGEEHFRQTLPYTNSADVRYRKVEGTTEGLPYVIEAAFGVYDQEHQDRDRSLITGLNWSPCLSMPIDGLVHILEDAQVNSHDPVTLAIHIACPRFDFTDRGKGRLRLPAEMMDGLGKAVSFVTKDFAKEKRRADWNGRLGKRQLVGIFRRERRSQLSTKEAAYASMEEAYVKASGNGSYPANARQIMYVARPLVQQLTGKIPPWKNTAYFTQILLPDYMEENHERTKTWDVVYDARGKLVEPHTGRRVDLGTLAVRNYVAAWTSSVRALDVGGIPCRLDTTGPANRYSYAMFIEKEGFDELLKRMHVAERYDLAVMSTKGMSVTAARTLVEELSERGVTILVLRDLDKAGFSIVHTLKASGRRYKYKTEPNVIDLGLRLHDSQEMHLEGEAVEYDSKIDPRISLKESGASDEEAVFLRSGGTPGQWKGSRIELNAMTSPQFVAFLETKLQEAGVKKVVPSEIVLTEAWNRAHRITFLEKALRDAEERFDGNRLSIPTDLKERVDERIKNTRMSWDDAVYEIVLNERQKNSG
ncbi:MAG: DNA topoisomerase VI subunit B [Syntrophorhabdus sp. PtaB.Bin047]|nr:MAG: DNA topoisomerase VI subunit B [Syntrophorhabdus sp. PtaB.Bin047]